MVSRLRFLYHRNKRKDTASPIFDSNGLIVPPKTVSNVPPAAETNVPLQWYLFAHNYGQYFSKN